MRPSCEGGQGPGGATARVTEQFDQPHHPDATATQAGLPALKLMGWRCSKGGVGWLRLRKRPRSLLLSKQPALAPFKRSQPGIPTLLCPTGLWHSERNAAHRTWRVTVMPLPPGPAPTPVPPPPPPPLLGPPP